MSALASLAFLFLLASGDEAQRPVVHDCRIKFIDLKAVRRPGRPLLIRAKYVAHDGTVLRSEQCPDQDPPSWGLQGQPFYTLSLDTTGYLATPTFADGSELTPGTVLLVRIDMMQRPAKFFSREKAFRY